MIAISPPWFVAGGILATALAQVLLKQSSHHGVLSATWLSFTGMAALAYGLSFLLYALVLRTYPLNKVYPVMTVAQIAIVTLYGLSVGETVDLRQALGLLLAGVAIYLILG
jgi:multidrug transporter EmrE-like cation transporter